VIPGEIVIVGAAETDVGKVPELDELALRSVAAHRALADAGLKLKDIDGLACSVAWPVDVAHYIGISPQWVDGTTVGGCSPLIHVRHAAAAISAGLCETVLILHGESGRSHVGRSGRAFTADSLPGQFEFPFGSHGAPTLFTIPAVRFLEATETTEAQLAAVPAMQSIWSENNPRAWRGTRVTVEDVLDSPIVAWPFHLLECCVVTDGGGALLVTSRSKAEARGSDRPLVYLLGSGEAVDSPMVTFLENTTSSLAFRKSSELAFASARLNRRDIDHLMIYDAFAHVPLFGLEDLGFVKRGEAGAFVAEGNTAPGGSLPMNTNGGGLCYTHTGMYGMFAIQEAVRQLRGEGFRQAPRVTTSFVQGVGGYFATAASLIMSNRAP